jgi:hypothetical protein
MAGFQVSMNGRIWVSPEENALSFSRFVAFVGFTPPVASMIIVKGTQLVI